MDVSSVLSGFYGVVFWGNREREAKGVSIAIVFNNDCYGLVFAGHHRPLLGDSNEDFMSDG